MTRDPADRAIAGLLMMMVFCCCIAMFASRIGFPGDVGWSVLSVAIGKNMWRIVQPESVAGTGEQVSESSGAKAVWCASLTLCQSGSAGAVPGRVFVHRQNVMAEAVSRRAWSPHVRLSSIDRIPIEVRTGGPGICFGCGLRYSGLFSIDRDVPNQDRCDKYRQV